MAKDAFGKRAKARRLRVALVPGDLPVRAQFAWPNIRENPTLESLEKFQHDTHRRDDVRLAVLNGLRRFAESSSQMMLGLAAFLLSYGSLFLATYGSTTPGFHIATYVIGGLMVGVLITYVARAVDLEERRRLSIVWLRAVEDAQSRPGSRLPLDRAVSSVRALVADRPRAISSRVQHGRPQIPKR